jgi:hypothetical protein
MLRMHKLQVVENACPSSEEKHAVNVEVSLSRPAVTEVRKHLVAVFTLDWCEIK